MHKSSEKIFQVIIIQVKHQNQSEWPPTLKNRKHNDWRCIQWAHHLAVPHKMFLITCTRWNIWKCVERQSMQLPFPNSSWDKAGQKWPTSIKCIVIDLWSLHWLIRAGITEWEQYLEFNKQLSNFSNERGEMRRRFTFFNRVSSAFISRNCCGIPLKFDCALINKPQSSFINRPVFFSIKPVNWIWTCLPSTFCGATHKSCNHQSPTQAFTSNKVDS